MKITLKNFRCYENYTLDFGEKGLTLISGSSGAGKSSILLAIYFALFGIGTKLTMYGKTSCSVILEFDDIIITRTKKPNRLVVEDSKEKYEDDSAQSIINKKFGETFDTTGYISQNAMNSFILMSPIEKLGFLEKFAFQDTDLLQIKIRCKNVINDRYETLLKCTSQLEMTYEMIKEFKEPEYVEFPLKNGTKEIPIKNREIAKKNLITKHKNVNTLISKCMKKTHILNTELHSLELLETKIQNKKDIIDCVKCKLDLCLTELEKYETLDSISIEKYEKQLSFILTNKELMSLQIRFEEEQKRLKFMKDEEMFNLQSKIKIIEQELWVEYTEEECVSTISEQKQTIKDIQKIKELKNECNRFLVDENELLLSNKELERLKNELDIKKKLQDNLELQKSVFQCPSCNKNLKFMSNKLYIHEQVIIGIEEHSNLSENISKLKKNILSLENNIIDKNNKRDRYKEIESNIFNITSQYLDSDTTQLPELIELEKDLTYIKKYISDQQNLDKQLKHLKDLKKSIENNQKYSDSIESFETIVQKQKRNIDFLTQKISSLEISDLNYEEEEIIRNKINTEKEKSSKIQTIKHNIKQLEKEKQEAVKQIEEFNENYKKEFSIGFREINKVKLELSYNKKEYEELEKDKIEIEKDIENIKKYDEYQQKLEYYKTWTDKLKILQKEENKYRREYGAATLLKEKILEAESIAMINVISSINTHSQVYLDCFFQDNPISVKLVTFRDTKKGNKKPQINLEIEYKGMECDLTSLSGGEISRVILAYTLALGEMFNTPIMLLDECTSSLDQELTNQVMEGIRDNFNGKLVLIIAHQVIKGSYDKVIEI
jgi:exonuclease SbcC